MSNENNKIQIDIENLFKQNVNDLSAIKELYRKLKEVEEKISQIKYIDSALANKLKKEYEKLKKIILDENVQAKLTNDIKTINSQLVTKLSKEEAKNIIETINSQLDTKVNKNEVTNGLNPKGNISYASLSTEGNNIGDYYYCPDGDSTHGAGNYVWSGTEWYFGGTGDEGYNKLSENINNIVPDITVDTSNKITSTLNKYDGYYITPTTGIMSVNSEFTTTSWIEISTESNIKIESDSQVLGVWGTADNKYISGFDYDAPVSKILQPPSNAKYVRVSCKTNVYNNLKVSQYVDLKLNKNISLLKNQIQDFEEVHTTVLEVGSEKQFATLKEAFASCINPSELNKYIVKFYGSENGVEYNLANEITESELSDSNFIGITIPPFTKLIGVGGKEKCILALRLVQGNTKVSPLNLYGSSSIDGITVIGKNTRYVIHDDYSSPDSIRTVENCKFISEGTTYLGIWGGGCRQGNEEYFKNCEFNANNESEATFIMHNNKGMTHPARLYIENCRFNGGDGVKIRTLRNNTYSTINEIYFYGCKISKLSLIEDNAELYGSGCLWKVSGYNNDLKSSDVIIKVTDGEDYSSYVDLI